MYLSLNGRVFPFDVTLSAAKGLSRSAARCFARVYTERSECAQHGSSRIVLPCYHIALVFPFDVTLSAAKGLSIGSEMLRCAQHDNASMTVLPSYRIALVH